MKSWVLAFGGISCPSLTLPGLVYGQPNMPTIGRQKSSFVLFLRILDLSFGMRPSNVEPSSKSIVSGKLDQEPMLASGRTRGGRCPNLLTSSIDQDGELLYMLKRTIR